MVFGMCRHCGGWTILVIGVLVLLNESMSWFSWAAFVGWLLVLLGALKAFVPSNCPNCREMMPARASGSKRRRR